MIGDKSEGKNYHQFYGQRNIAEACNVKMYESEYDKDMELRIKSIVIFFEWRLVA